MNQDEFLFAIFLMEHNLLTLNIYFYFTVCHIISYQQLLRSIVYVH